MVKMISLSELNVTELEPDYFFSPAFPDQDSRPADVHTFLPHKKPDLLEILSQYIESLRENDDHRLIKNYVGLKIQDHFAVSLWMYNGHPVGFATVWNRPFYGTQTVRLLNRIYHDKSRSRVGFTREVGRPSTVHCLVHQLNLASRYGFKYGFISREPRSLRFFRMFIGRLNEVTGYRWEFDAGPYRVAPGNGLGCWQAIGYTNLQGDSPSSFLKEVSFEKQTDL